MTNEHPDHVSGAITQDSTDAHINELVQQHGYAHPIAIAARLEQWISRYGRQDSGTLVMGEAMRALRLLAQPVSGADGLPDSPTRGMNLGQRIAHVGGRENAQGYVEFGSPMAVDALIQHVLRDMTTSTREGAFQARYRMPGGPWSSWGAVTCGVKGHEQELRYLATEAQPQPSGNARHLADDIRVGILADSSYAEGMKVGYQMGTFGDGARYQKAQARLHAQLREARAEIKGQPSGIAETVLVDGEGYVVPAAVAAELLRLNIELRQSSGNHGQLEPSGNALSERDTERQANFAMERALSELVDKIAPGLDTGDLLADAATASKALDAKPSGNAGELQDAARFASGVLSDIYAKYQVKIGPFASQAQLANTRLRAALATQTGNLTEDIHSC